MFKSIFSKACRALMPALLVAFTSQASAAGYHTQAGKIYDGSNQEIQLRGISHYGFNATILQPQFLWSMGWKQQIAQIKSLGFNAVRLPFVPDTLYTTTTVDKLSYIDASLNPELIGKTPLQALDLWMAEAERQGLYVLLDFHSVSMQRQYPTWFVSNPADFGLIYNKAAYTPDNWKRDLAFVAKRYANLPHFFAIDIYNEPNGVVRWSTGDANMTDAANYWKPAVESASVAVLAANPNLLIFVQGINGNFDNKEATNIPMNWGEDFQPQAYQPLNVAAGKLVLTPHTYGPDVYQKISFSAANFPANLAANWDTLFGQFAQTIPVVVGEWGGKYGTGTGGQLDVTWQNAFVDYSISKGMRSSFFWCYTPNSGDTGGILDDSLVVRQDKLALLKKLWGTPPAVGVTAPVTNPPVASPPVASPPVANPPVATTPVVIPPAVKPPVTNPPVATAPGGTTTPTAPVGNYAQPGIMSFAPGSGAPGTVVTMYGNGFTGLTAAWVGAAKNGAVKVISDTQVQVTIPVGATTGAIGLLNPARAAFTANAFAVTAGGPVNPQQAVQSFSPASGPVGTVVTVKGSGFTGSNLAWVGAAHGAVVKVISDTQVQVTVPAGASTGAIGVFNPAHGVFTASAFTVTAAVQQGIQNFFPAAGPVGTVVTLNGSGFSGTNVAWIGAAHNGVVTVLSDKQAQVTIPPGATSGAIGLFNSGFAAFTASAFQVQ
jgi:aryl-phospho-beta-D-glucosidase BglC (GH1 family)